MDKNKELSDADGKGTSFLIKKNKFENHIFLCLAIKRISAKLLTKQEDKPNHMFPI